jgi:hypothetical protein
MEEGVEHHATAALNPGKNPGIHWMVWTFLEYKKKDFPTRIRTRDRPTSSLFATETLVSIYPIIQRKIQQYYTLKSNKTCQIANKLTTCHLFKMNLL